MNIARLRKARNLSQRALAEKVGYDQSTIQRAESMKDGVTIGVYQLIAQALDVELSDLFSDIRNLDELRLIEAYRVAGDRERRLLQAMASEAKALPPPTDEQAE